MLCTLSVAVLTHLGIVTRMHSILLLCTIHLYPRPPWGTGLAGLLTAIFKALLKALLSGAKIVDKSLLKSPSLPGADNNEEQQMT